MALQSLLHVVFMWSTSRIKVNLFLWRQAGEWRNVRERMNGCCFFFSFFFSFPPQKLWIHCNEICIYLGYVLYKVEIIFPQSPTLSKHFLTFVWDAVFWLHKMVAEALGLFLHAVFHLVICSRCPQNASFKRPRRQKSKCANLVW